MSNALLDIYTGYEHAKNIWDALNRKYGSDDADQIHAYENVCIAMDAKGLCICDITFAIVLIEKLPPSWKDFRNQLMHKRKELTLEELVGHLKIEEEIRIKDKGNSVFSSSAKANLIVGTGATRHICSNKNMFTTYKKIDGENIFMGNSSSSTVKGKGFGHGVLFTLGVKLEIMNKNASASSAKFVKKSFKSIDRQAEVPELVQRDLRLKDEAEEMFFKYKAEVENQLDRNIKRLSSDRGGGNIIEARDAEFF
ncbi:uncharacterized protein [Spinacia oleracea]|uniref:Retrovirus-related Pol polyprotein from transposon TNT 1-94-like beta-barrel domain-containing protein n=1 Tax=Spinacia oleracea TaxID=3562 RepID=A0ABM3RQW9_SPIOL|nr:uncharacterized protein LOC130471749 [Spinacia oleracea]